MEKWLYVMTIKKGKTYNKVTKAVIEEADALCRQEPLVVEGYATYLLAALQVADKENNYLL